jgi:hypothetical protein
MRWNPVFLLNVRNRKRLGWRGKVGQGHCVVLLVLMRRLIGIGMGASPSEIYCSTFKIFGIGHANGIEWMKLTVMPELGRWDWSHYTRPGNLRMDEV